MGMESQATGKLHPWWKGGKVYWHFCRAKPLVFVRKAAWEESQEMFVTCTSSVPSISQRGQGEGRRVSTVRRVIAASLLYCAHGCSSPFVLQCLTGVWVLHLSDSSISLMFMGLAGGGCAVLSGCESHCASLPRGLCVPKWSVFTLKVMLSGGRKACLALAEVTHNWEASAALWRVVTLLPSSMFILHSHRCQECYLKVFPTLPSNCCMLLNACLQLNWEKKICIPLWIKLEAFLSGSFYQCACISNQPT